MLVAFILLILGIMAFDAKKRLKALESRLAMLETERAVPDASSSNDAFHESAESRSSPARVVYTRPWADEAAPPAAAIPAPHEAEPADTQAPHAMEGQMDSGTEQREAPVHPEPAQSEPAQRQSAKPSFGFEELFGRRLPIWAGGVTLAVAGVLLVKYSIDAGLLSPLVRILMGLVFGGALIGGAELALRQEERVRDPRVRQSLAGAGLATLYASILAAHTLYALVGPTTAFIGLAAVTALAMGLALRFGAPSALLGLVGGLAAPALVNAGQPNIPLLSCYLALAIGGLCALSRTQRWMWLGVSALIGGAGWGAALLVMGALDMTASISVGLLLLALGIFLPLFAFSGTRGTIIRVGAAIVAAAQMAALVATGGFALLNWGLFGLLSIALVWLGGREKSLRPLSAVGLGVALLLAGAWTAPNAGQFTLVMLIMATIYGGGALWRLWRVGGSLVEAGQIAGLTLGGVAISMIHFYRPDASLDGGFGLLALAAAMLPAIAMALGWRNAGRRDDARFALLATITALLLVVAGGLGLFAWTLPIVIAIVATGLLLLAERADDQRVEWSSWAFAFSAIVGLVAGRDGEWQAIRLLGETAPTASFEPFLRWAIVALVAALFAWRARFIDEGKLVAQSAAIVLGYGALAQCLSSTTLPVVTALGLPLLAQAARRLRQNGLLPAFSTLSLILLLWAIWPMAEWSAQAFTSLLGEPMLASALPGLGESLRRLAIPALLLAIALWHAKGAIHPLACRASAVAASAMGGIALHIGYKQLFALSDMADVTRLALAERTVWEALLLAAAYAVWRFAGAQLAALVLLGVALGHSILYTLLLHNPLWYAQYVGVLPILNLLIPAFAIPFAALWMATRIHPDLAGKLARPADLLRMLVIILFATATLRHLFAGSILTIPGLGEMEDILRSVLALGLAIGFLLWGICTNSRDWRIASLLLMLAAVAKVFLFDASGLQGLLRIASFLALGFSLIGIGWLYNRVLRAPE
ncbi:DUF2339 domain-containing protein [Sphingobium aromaticiconvertens]|uniref:DUF2339 domain-containing protein n=1 Tax=Sphingobium aromaticiconvertens TaxID=365341 RepID=UPI0030197A03